MEDKSLLYNLENEKDVNKDNLFYRSMLLCLGDNCGKKTYTLDNILKMFDICLKKGGDIHACYTTDNHESFETKENPLFDYVFDKIVKYYGIRGLLKFFIVLKDNNVELNYIMKYGKSILYHTMITLITYPVIPTEVRYNILYLCFGDGRYFIDDAYSESLIYFLSLNSDTSACENTLFDAVEIDFSILDLCLRSVKNKDVVVHCIHSLISNVRISQVFELFEHVKYYLNLFYLGKSLFFTFISKYYNVFDRSYLYRILKMSYEIGMNTDIKFDNGDCINNFLVRNFRDPEDKNSIILLYNLSGNKYFEVISKGKSVTRNIYQVKKHVFDKGRTYKIYNYLCKKEKYIMFYMLLIFKKNEMKYTNVLYN
jgi:hypothetical protein